MKQWRKKYGWGFLLRALGGDGDFQVHGDSNVCIEPGCKRAANTNLTIDRKSGKWLSTQAWHQPAWV